MIKYLLVGCLFFLFSCREEGEKPGYATKELIFPDYRGVTIPRNIAPLSFCVNLPDANDRVRVLFRTQPHEVTHEGKDVRFTSQEWKKLMLSDSLISVRIQKLANNSWIEVDSFDIHISSELIDPYLSYRLIAPGYELWGEMGIYQRSLSGYEEDAIYENSESQNTCVNCHAFNQGDPEEFIFHQRPKPSGTILVKDGEVRKLNTDYTKDIKSLVYPSWHSSGKYIAFSVNKTVQAVHSSSRNRIEVMDLHSDIVILDIRKNELLTNSRLSSADVYETFPCFSADGRKLYFCSARAVSLPDSFNQVRYNLCSLEVDLSRGVLGNKIDTLIRADTLNFSISFPKISPDGRFMLYTRHAYGNFSIWHREADLCMYDLRDRKNVDVSILNSDEAESYHSWSSNGRWIVFSSRRMTGLYTCLYLAYVDASGHVGKPFLLPQKQSDYYFYQYKSYNVPEFIRSKVCVKRKEVRRTMEI